MWIQISSRIRRLALCKPAYLLIPILFLFAACTTIPGEMSDPDVLRAQAELALDEGDLPTALVKLRRAYSEDGDNIETLRLMARFYATSNSTTEQRQVLQQLLTVDPSNAYGLEQLGLLELQAGQLNQADNYFKFALVIDSQRWMALNGLGVIADNQIRYAEAAAYFLKALAIVPGHPKLLANLGWSKLLAGDLPEAESRLQESLQAEPDSITTRSNLAFSIALQGRYQEALQLYETLYSEPVAANNVGYAALSRGDSAAARRYFDTAVKNSPSFYRKAVNNRLSVK